MKVAQDKSFSPIIITLYTPEEADQMFHILNCGQGQSLSAYYETKGLEPVSNTGMYMAYAREHTVEV